MTGGQVVDAGYDWWLIELVSDKRLWSRD
jgi:hypothetical protein